MLLRQTGVGCSAWLDDMRFHITMASGLISFLAFTIWVVAPKLKQLDWSPELKTFALMLYALAGAGLLVWLSSIAMNKDLKR